VAEKLFELLKYPIPGQRATANTVRQVFHDQGAPDADAGQWALVRWTKKQFPKIDLDSPAPTASAP